MLLLNYSNGKSKILEKSRSNPVVVFKGNSTQHAGTATDSNCGSGYLQKSLTGIAQVTEGLLPANNSIITPGVTTHFYDPKTHSIGQTKRKRTPNELRALLTGK